MVISSDGEDRLKQDFDPNPNAHSLEAIESLQSEEDSASNRLSLALEIVRQKQQPANTRINAIHIIIDQFQSEHFQLFKALLDDDAEHPDIRSAAALAVGKLGGLHNKENKEDPNSDSDQALGILMPHANSKDVTVKNYTVQALGLLGREEGIPSLIEALGDSDNIIFASAAEALGAVGRLAVPHLMALLTNPQEGIKDDSRCVAAWQLGQLRFRDAVPALLSAIFQHQNVEIQALCLWALGEIGHSTPEILEILHWAKDQQDSALHERAVMAIHKITRHLN